MPFRHKSSGTRLIVAVADIHCGSTYGLMPPGFTTLEGNEILHNPIQRWLWQCWTDATTRWLPTILRGDPYALVVNGDAMEGNHHGTREIVSPETGDHFTAAEAVLKPLADAAEKTFLVEGTDCHVGNHEHGLAKNLKATKDPDSQKPAWPILTLIAAGCRYRFQHHISTTGRTYLEASGLGIYLGNEQLEAAKNGEPFTQVLCCAHRHRYGEFRDASGLSIVIPPWQMLTKHGRKGVPSARTRPGIVVFDHRGLPDGSLPMTHSQTYRAPTPTGATL